MKQQHVYMGFYSAEAARKYGVVIYRNELGQKIAVTCVVRMPREYAMQWFQAEYGWSDKKIVGEVCDDCIGRIEGETVTQTVCSNTRFGQETHNISMDVPGTPGVFNSFGFIPTPEDTAELIEIAKRTTGYSPLAVFSTPVPLHVLAPRTNRAFHHTNFDLSDFDLDEVVKTYRSFERFHKKVPIN